MRVSKLRLKPAVKPSGCHCPALSEKYRTADTGPGVSNQEFRNEFSVSHHKATLNNDGTQLALH
jgi:hypothetical protein